MSIPKNISKENLIQAAERIIEEGIPSNGHSSTYDVFYKGHQLPPKLIVSYANLYPNGIELDRNSFAGGIGTECFKLLEDNDFIIQEKSRKITNEPKVWFVAQGITFTETEGMKFLWAPAKGATGRTHSYWDNVQKVKKGDIIFNYSSGLKGVSVASTDGYIADNINPKSTWETNGYKVDIELTLLNPIITGNQLASKKDHLKFLLSSINNKPFSSNGGVNQGYLYEFTKDAARFIRGLYGKPFGNKIIDDYLDNNTSEVIEYKKMSYTDLDQKYIREIVSIKTKPFIILAGLSGTGKSRLVRTLSYLFNNVEEDKINQIHPPSNFQLIKVKPNWHDSSELLGYESRISGKDRFISTDFIRFIVKAWQKQNTPFFLCLDEMNLAPVEQYFAEYLSVIETRRLDKIGNISSDALISSSLFRKYASKTDGVDPAYDLWTDLEVSDVLIQQELQEKGLRLPPNLIVMGTVNMDETTHSFSRKVLDRAMTFEMNDINLSEGLKEAIDDWNYPELYLEKKVILSEKTQGTEVYNSLASVGDQIIKYLDEINTKLEGSPFKIAYRVRDEFLLYAYNYSLISSEKDWLINVFDDMTLMKILPRIEGDEERTKLLDDLVIIFKNKNLPRSLKKALEMVNKRDRFHYTSFWS